MSTPKEHYEWFKIEVEDGKSKELAMFNQLQDITDSFAIAMSCRKLNKMGRVIGSYLEFEMCFNAFIKLLREKEGDMEIKDYKFKDFVESRYPKLYRTVARLIEKRAILVNAGKAKSKKRLIKAKANCKKMKRRGKK